LKLNSKQLLEKQQKTLGGYFILPYLVDIQKHSSSKYNRQQI